MGLAAATWGSRPPTAGAASPRHGHDLSFEVKQAFSTRGSDYQLEANVENDSHRDVECVRSAHYSGGTTSDDLDQVYRNLIVFDPHADSTIDR